MPKAYIYPNLKHCATCVYWTGNRTFNTFAKYAEVNDSSATAQCTNKKQYCGTYKPQAHNGCSYYETHPAIK